jgi:hypothetical protein
VSKAFEDRVEEEVRRRVTSAASAAGVDRGRVELEVVWLLPPEFMRLYRAIFSRALADPISPTGDGGKDEGRVKAKGKPADAMRARSMAGAAKGRRFVQGAWPVRDEAALEAKNRLDRKILAAVRESWDTLVPPSRASFRASRQKDQTNSRRCPDCGLYQSPGWLRCPFHAAEPG